MSLYSLWRTFSVKSLDAAAFTEAAEQLATQARPYAPTIIIGIRTGGYFLAEIVAKHIPEATLLAITCRRPSTDKKRSLPFIKNILRYLPHAITDRLRIGEHILLTQLRPPAKKALIPDENELASIKHCLNEQKEANILIVDDAVDSGATLLAVTEAIKSVASPRVVIKIAAVTVTTDTPLLSPDFVLYRHVLCRFPWSLDARK